MRRILIEAPVFTVQAALQAAKCGIDRIELCADFGEGGVTPSAGMLSFLKSTIDIPIFVMIRPRGGDFFYDTSELDIMEHDIRILDDLGADGFVFGMLDAHGRIDKEACHRLIQAAGSKPCTFHRAFDVCQNHEEALKDIVALGFDRLLTSGGKANPGKGMGNLENWIGEFGDQIIIMPGGGLSLDHMDQLLALDELKEVHASCKVYTASEVVYEHNQEEIKMSISPDHFYQRLTVDPELVAAFLRKINR
ncbi:copper homeostasis protein CutC [Belliella kenyensis]|uniref:PF03932 family protein CutC n=1 Tax=Belliella kenyensis TaxID=1472724 RepID=A0ABV8EM20_9BACT|nr:copper homeostasis protein CutC [Belliella kenyensis]MCH7403576.1 copper homeostasis protein CutC [Belliella kenyensis]MDN3603872.1 copper homeostasis protein CutC [Belliella kenyensis]